MPMVKVGEPSPEAITANEAVHGSTVPQHIGALRIPIAQTTPDIIALITHTHLGIATIVEAFILAGMGTEATMFTPLNQA
jgi:hypothetical protein